MSYVKVGNEKMGSVTLPANAHGHFGSMSDKTTKQDPLSTSRQRKFPLAMVALLAATFAFTPAARAQGVAPPIAGVLGQVQSVGDHSITIRNKSGIFHINITQPLTTYHEVPSDLNQITDNDYLSCPADKSKVNKWLQRTGSQDPRDCAPTFHTHEASKTRITDTKDEPSDYWAKRGYSRYDGI